MEVGALEHDVRDPRLTLQSEVLREHGLTEVEVDERDVASRAGQRDCEIGDRRRLPLALDRARHHDHPRIHDRRSRTRDSSAVDEPPPRTRPADRGSSSGVPSFSDPRAGSGSRRGTAGRGGARSPLPYARAYRASPRGRRCRGRAGGRRTRPGSRCGSGSARSAPAPVAGLTTRLGVWSSSIVRSCCALSTRSRRAPSPTDRPREARRSGSRDPCAPRRAAPCQGRPCTR